MIQTQPSDPLRSTRAITFSHLASLVEEGELPVELCVQLFLFAFVEAAEVLVVAVPVQDHILSFN